MSFFNTSKLAGIFSNSAKALLTASGDVHISEQLIAHTTRPRALAKQVTVDLQFEGISRKRFKGVILPRVNQVVENLARSSEEMSSVRFSETEHTAEKCWKLSATMSVEAWEELLPELEEVTSPGSLKRLCRKQPDARFADPANVIGFDVMLGAQ